MPGARPAAVALSFEEPQPWELAQGSTVTRTRKVSTDAQQVFAQQEQILPTLHHDHTIDPAVTEHIQDVGRRVLILREHAKQPDKVQQHIFAKRTPKRVIPSRFHEPNEQDDDGDDDANADGNSDDAAATDAYIATMLMDQEWDTRTWNAAKVHGAIETLYNEIELTDDTKRRALATTMLIRLLETHEDAVTYVETTIPVLMNRAFRSLSKRTDCTKVFRVAELLAVLAEWFAPILSRENAATKCIRCLLRETELCARIVQHHWRGVALERRLRIRSDRDATVSAQLRAMHLVTHMELRHQFKVLRDAIGTNGLPDAAVASYVTILYHLVQHRSGDSHDPSHTTNYSRAAVADQTKVLGSGVLALLASLVQREYATDVAEMAKAIVQTIAAVATRNDVVVAILASNVVHRVIYQVEHMLAHHDRTDSTCSSASFASSLEVVATLATATLRGKQMLERASISGDDRAGPEAERAYHLRALTVSAQSHLVTPTVVRVLFSALQSCSSADIAANTSLCITVLVTLRQLAGAFGFANVLDALTRSGGRCLEVLLRLFDDADARVSSTAVQFFYELTDNPDARNGLTTAGAPQLLLSWFSTPIECSRTPMLHVLGLVGIALLARQTCSPTPSAPLLAALPTLATRIDALYSLLLDLALHVDADRTALYLLAVNAMPQLLLFLCQATPSRMTSAFQTAHQRNVSCVVLSRIVRLPLVAQKCVSEVVVVHLALALQCNRLDAIEHTVASRSTLERRVHVLGARDACKALSRLCRTASSSPFIDAQRWPSATPSSAHVPALPQARICDVVCRLHALEDVVGTIACREHDSVEFPDLTIERTLAAVELCGYLRPLPFGDTARATFVRSAIESATQAQHVAYATDKLMTLVAVVAPAILHVLRDTSACAALVSACCTALSRLACTNAACSALLTLGALDVALVHVPQTLSAATTPSRQHHSQHQHYMLDASVDDDGLLDVPTSLFTLVGKLCAVADGRAAVMRAQVLPRLLKRLQLQSDCNRSSTADAICKSEIAVVVQRLALVSSVEGNTSELFLHFHVLALLVQLARAHQDVVADVLPARATAKQQQQLQLKRQCHKWRVLDRAVGAIAALSQDVLVCVPTVVELGVVQFVLPFIVRAHNGVDDPAATRSEALQYHALTIVRSVAAFPFGKYHALLASVEDKSPVDQSADALLPARLLDRVKKVAYNFALELASRRPSTTSSDSKSLGELARETLTFIHNCAQRASDSSQPSLSCSPTKVPATECRRTPPTRLLDFQPRTPLEQDDRRAFPALPGSPSTSQRRESVRAAQSDSPRATQLAPVRSTPLLPSQLSPSQHHASPRHTLAGSIAASPTAATTPQGASALCCVDLMRTRPAGHKPPQSSSTDSVTHTLAPYVFARPKRKHKKPSLAKHDTAESCSLMLDPLFQMSAALPSRIVGSVERRRQHKSAAQRSRMAAAHIDELAHEHERRATSFVYMQEVERLGHCVSVKARRATAGDTYVQSLGHITMGTISVESPAR